MNKLLLVSLITSLTVSSAFAIKIPKGIYRVAKIEEARNEAAEDELAIAYIRFPENIKPS